MSIAKNKKLSTAKGKFYITTSIAYVNAPPHIGFALETVQADALARYHRLKNEEVFFLSGTDENSEKISQSALKVGRDPLQIIDENAEKFKLLLKTLNISNSDFIRTTDRIKHWPAAQEIWRRVEKKGDIYKKKYGGYYCIGCEAFKTEKDLIDGKCPLHNTVPEWREEENYFFRWSNHQKFLENHFEKNSDFVVPKARYNEMKEFLKRGLEDISISRVKEKIPWGIPVPGDNAQVMYVWFDALTNYLSGLGFPDKKEKFRRSWPADIHLVGKDIDRWHSLLWPAMLHSAGLPLPKRIYVHGFITSKGQKMSKTLGNVIDPFEVAKKYGVDALRYYLLKEIPSSEDGDFTYEKFEKVYASDLQNGLGNLVARVLTMVENYFDGKIPEFNEKYREEVKVPKEIAGDILWEKNGKKEDVYDMQDVYFTKTHPENLSSYYDRFEFNSILGGVNDFVSVLDKYIQHYEPFKLVKTNKEKTAGVLCNCLYGIEKIAWLIRPFMPETSDKIFKQLFADEKEREKIKKIGSRNSIYDRYIDAVFTHFEALKPGTKIKKGGVLFPRLK